MNNAVVAELTKDYEELSKKVNSARQDLDAAQSRYLHLKSKLDALRVVLNMKLPEVGQQTIPSPEYGRSWSGTALHSWSSSSSSSRQSPLRGLIIEVLSRHKEPVKASDIRKELRERQQTFDDISFWRLLKRLEIKGWVKRSGFGLYQLADKNP